MVEEMKGLSLEEAIELLEESGIYGAKYGSSGRLKVPKTEYVKLKEEVISESISSRPLPTKPLYRLAQATQRAQFLPLWPPCIFGFEPWCIFYEPPTPRWIRKYAPPKIDFDIHAIKVKKADVYLLRGRIEGELDTLFFNKSEEGETWEENPETGEQRNRQKVPGSADLWGFFRELVTLKKIQELLADVRSTLGSTAERIKPQVKITINNHFTKESYREMIKNIWNILKEGRMWVDDDFDVTVRYNWLGEEKTITKKIHLEAYLPVDEVDYHLW